MQTNNSPMRIILCTHPSDVRQAAAHGHTLGHMAYKIGPDGHLYRNGLGISVRGGLMSLSDIGLTAETEYSDEIIREIKRECDQRGFTGVICDFEQEPGPFSTHFVYEAAIFFAKLDMAFYIPRKMSEAAPTARLLVSSVVIGGSCGEQYQKLASSYPRDRLAIIYEPVCLDFIMPSPNGQEDFITQAQLNALIKRENAVPYFSSELCAYYFTYRDENGKSHFVLFDNENSMVKKLALAKSFGINEALLLYQEAYEVIDSLSNI